MIARLDVLQLLLKRGHSKLVRKNEHLLRSDEVCKRIYFIKSGVVRHYVLDHKSTEKTIRLSQENDFFYSSIVSHFTGDPSYISCQALTDTTLLYWEKCELDTLMEQHPEVAAFRNQQLISFIIEKHEKELSLIVNDSASRLEAFNRERISLFNRVPHRILASYLNISPETLSRLRSVIS
ncbi:MAG: Crp/Fnr family transcriptional regulator [Marinoscillum sp.]|uniref:Crp/Fnr family transcriptional regulator n=1 Tax=Marinoscillum sp. TaxID=2024838 RepID=UPI003302FC48